MLEEHENGHANSLHIPGTHPYSDLGTRVLKAVARPNRFQTSSEQNWGLDDTVESPERPGPLQGRLGFG